MKHSEPQIPQKAATRHKAALINMYALPLVMLVPNVALNITETSYTFPDEMCNILLPAAGYLALSAGFRRAGTAGLLSIPIIILCAFQIVLLFLYGKSIIAVDMFLNVATTNFGEASELLRSLGAAILSVALLYLPPLIVSVITFAKKTELDRIHRRRALITAAALGAAGCACAVQVMTAESPRVLLHRLFPVNVTANIHEAVQRTLRTSHYGETSRDFTFGARCASPGGQADIYLLVIGETARADNWQLNGYGRPTNPRLSQRAGLLSFKKALTESNTTHKSVPMLLSHLDSGNFGDSIYVVKSIAAAFGEAGFHTAWLSNQKRNGALIDFFGEGADETRFLCDDGRHHYDMELCGKLDEILENHSGERLFVILHTYGSHFNYKERYPEKYRVFHPDNTLQATAGNRASLLNAYDNSVLYTDALLDSIISTVETHRARAAMVYLADHGEDIYDDSRGRFLHASPTPTYWQLHVPMLVWMSHGYRAAHPDKYVSAVANTGKNVSSSRSAFHTLLSLAGIETCYYEADAALSEKQYTEPERTYLNDYNEAVSLGRSGIEAEDFSMLASRRISAH